MRLTKEQIARTRSVWKDVCGLVSISAADGIALLDMADELLALDVKTWVSEQARLGALCDKWKRKYEELSRELNAQHGKYRHEVIDDNIRDLRDICETLAKRIAALEGFNWHIPHTFTPSSFWRASTKSMSPDERKGQRRNGREERDARHYKYRGAWHQGRRMADRRVTGKRIERRRHWVADRRQQDPACVLARREDNRRQGPNDRRGVMTCTYGRMFWRTSTNETSTDERKAQRRQCEPTGYSSGLGHLPFYLSADNKWLVDSRRQDGKDRRKPK